MKPPVTPPKPVSTDKPGYFAVEVAGVDKDSPVRYLVQLPPEYDPYRRYPTIVTLHGQGRTAEDQVVWWAGNWTGRFRKGMASLKGYIVIAPEWAGRNQTGYGYSAWEHVAVLNSLRDACRRFSIDTDRVFLSGHSMGGDAAWDIGLAHPDLWAGVMPIAARADRYCNQYWEHAKHVPFYVVCGELDGGQLAKNAMSLDRYLNRAFNCTVVEYQGRGHERFYDEIKHLFDWMSHFRRDFFPLEFTCFTMRPWDNFFWWIELDNLPPKTMVDPAAWPPRRGVIPFKAKATLTADNGINVMAGRVRTRIWVSPEMVDFDERVDIKVNGKRINHASPYIEPDLETMLEDVRTRGDRQHPFWAMFDTAKPRGRSGT